MKLLMLGLALCMMVWLVDGHESEGSSSATSPEFPEAIPLIECDTDKECKKVCQSLKVEKDKTACSSLKFCTGPPIVYEKKQRVKRMQDTDAYDDSDDYESEETKKGVCNDKKNCKKDTDCAELQSFSFFQDEKIGATNKELIIKTAGRVCTNGKCAWNGMFSSSSSSSISYPNHPGSGQPHLEPAVMGES